MSAPWPMGDEMIALAEREVAKQWAPWGEELVEALRTQAVGDPLSFYRLLCRALETPTDVRVGFLTGICTAAVGRNTGAA